MTVQIKHVYSSLMASLSKKSVYFEIFKFEIKENLIFYIFSSKRCLPEKLDFLVYMENMPEKEK